MTKLTKQEKIQKLLDVAAGKANPEDINPNLIHCDTIADIAYAVSRINNGEKLKLKSTLNFK